MDRFPAPSGGDTVQGILELETAYGVSLQLTDIYNRQIDRGVVLTFLAHWYDRVERLGIKYFRTVIETVQNNYATIVNYLGNDAKTD